LALVIAKCPLGFENLKEAALSFYVRVTLRRKHE
jgi:hypothetical protein